MRSCRRRASPTRRRLLTARSTSCPPAVCSGSAAASRARIVIDSERELRGVTTIACSRKGRLWMGGMLPNLLELEMGDGPDANHARVRASWARPAISSRRSTSCASIRAGGCGSAPTAASTSSTAGAGGISPPPRGFCGRHQRGRLPRRQRRLGVDRHRPRSVAPASPRRAVRDAGAERAHRRRRDRQSDDRARRRQRGALVARGADGPVPLARSPLRPDLALPLPGARHRGGVAGDDRPRAAPLDAADR